MRKVAIASFSVFLIGVLLFSVVGVLVFQNVRPDSIMRAVKEYVETQFDVTCSLNKLSVFFDTLSLSNVNVSSVDQSSSMAVKKVQLRCDFLSLFRKKISALTSIDLHNPVITLGRDNWALLFSDGEKKHIPRLPVTVTIDDGTLYVDVPFSERPIAFDQVDLKAKMKGFNTILFDAAGQGTDIITGDVTVKGSLSLDQKKRDIEIELNNISCEVTPFFSFNGLRGTVHLNKHEVIFERVEGFIRNFPIIISGSIRFNDRQPMASLLIETRSNNHLMTCHLDGPLDDMNMKGELQVGDHHMSYEGILVIEGDGLRTRKLKVNNGYFTRAHILFKGDSYFIGFYKENESRFLCSMKWDKRSMLFDIDAQHVSLFGYDVVYVGNATVTPDLQYWQDGDWVFHTELDTDYAIFNFIPLDNLSGRFTVRNDRVDDVFFKWGRVYRLMGEIYFSDGYPMEAELNIDGLDLSLCETVLGRTLPGKMQGVVESRVTFNGLAQDPAIKGYFRALDGTIKDLSFEKLVLHFEGTRKCLSLSEAKVYHDTATLDLAGSIDFTVDDMFHNIHLDSDESIILLEGWDMTKRAAEDTIHLKRGLGDNVAMNVASTITSDDSGDGARRENEVSVDYAYGVGDGKSLSLGVIETDDEESVQVKHTMRF